MLLTINMGAVLNYGGKCDIWNNQIEGKGLGANVSY